MCFQLVRWIQPVRTAALSCSPKNFTAVLLMGWLNVCFQLGIGKVNSRTPMKFAFFGEQAKNMSQTKKRIKKKNISVCLTTSVTTQPTSSAERAMTFFWEGCHLPQGLPRSRKILVPIYPVQSADMQLILITIRIVKVIRNEKLTTPHLLKPISLWSSTLSLVTSLWKATVQKIFHISVSRLANWFSYMCYFS